MSKDYYKILGVAKNSSEEDIKKAYRKLAHQYHPDKAGGNEQKFKEINEAYQVLSNKEKKAQYDRFGQVFDGSQGFSSQGGPANGWGFGFDGNGMRWDMGGDMGDFGDIFESIFEQFGGGGQRRQTYKRGSDIEAVIELTLEEAFSGVKRALEFKMYVLCSLCGGIGHDEKAGVDECTTCKGKGEIREQRQTFFGNFSQIKACPSCNGRGSIPKKSCVDCKGNGRVIKRRQVTVDIAPGVEDGQILTMKGMGEAGERGSGNGDLYVAVRVKPHSVFIREKIDLRINQEIKFIDALLGKKIIMKDINGETFSVAIPAGFNLRDKLKVSGKGMTRFGSTTNRGDLYISFNIKTPKSLSARAKKLLEELEGEV